MSYQVRDEDLPTIIHALRVMTVRCTEHSRTVALPATADSFKKQAADYERIANEMEAEG